MPGRDLKRAFELRTVEALPLPAADDTHETAPTGDETAALFASEALSRCPPGTIWKIS